MREIIKKNDANLFISINQKFQRSLGLVLMCENKILEWFGLEGTPHLGGLGFILGFVNAVYFLSGHLGSFSLGVLSLVLTRLFFSPPHKI